MTNTLHSPEGQAVVRLFELSCSGETDKAEFSQLANSVYERMFESYNAASEQQADESIS